MDRKNNSKSKYSHYSQMPYPTNHTLAIFDKLEDVNAFKQDLQIYGVKENTVDVITGEDGLAMIDSKGKKHSFFDKLMRTVERFWGSGEFSFFQKADEELKIGHILVTVLTPHQKLKNDIVSLLKTHAAHDITYFNSMYVESVPSKIL